MRSDRPFPFELVTLVASFASPGTVANLTRLSRDINRVLTPQLYRRLVITRANVDKLFLGLPRRAELHAGRKPGSRQAFKEEARALRDKFPDIFDEYEAEERAMGAGGENATANGASPAVATQPLAGNAAPPAAAAEDDDDSDEDSDASFVASDSDSEEEFFEDTDDDIMYAGGVEASLDAETDDELAPPFAEIQAASASCTWERRLELFRHTESVTFVQIPGWEFASDLVYAVETMDPNLCPPGGARTYRQRLNQAAERSRRAAWEYWDAYDGPVIFPSVQKVAFSSRVLQQRQLYRLRAAFESPAFMQPRHACLTIPSRFDVAAHFRRSIARRVAQITREQVLRVPESWRAARDDPTARIRRMLPPTLESFTVHNLKHGGYTPTPPVWSQRRWGERKPCIPMCGGLGTRNRMFYTPTVEEPDLADAIVATRMGIPQDEAFPETAPNPQSWEFIGPMPHSTVERVHALLARPENAPEYGDLTPGEFDPGDLERAHADLNAAEVAEDAATRYARAALLAARDNYLRAVTELEPAIGAALAGLESEADHWREKREKALRDVRAYKGKSAERQKQLLERHHEVDAYAEDAQRDAERLDSVAIAGMARGFRAQHPELASLDTYLGQHEQLLAAREAERTATVRKKVCLDRVQRAQAASARYRRARRLQELEEKYGRREEDVTFLSEERVAPCEVCGEKNKVDGDLHEIIAKAHNVVL